MNKTRESFAQNISNLTYIQDAAKNPGSLVGGEDQTELK